MAALRELLLNSVKAQRVKFTPTDSITSKNVQGAIEELASGDVGDVDDIIKQNQWMLSPGIAEGGIVSQGTNTGTFKVTEITKALLRTEASQIAPLELVILAEQDNQVIPEIDTVYYIVFTYGNPCTISLSETQPNGFNEIPIGKISKDSSDVVYYISGGYRFGDGISKLHKRAMSLRSLELKQGSVIAYSGTNNFTLTSGIVFGGVNEYPLSPYDSAVTQFTSVYKNGSGGWTEASSNTIDYGHFDDGSGTLDTIKNNMFGVHYIFKHADDQKVYTVYGLDSYALAEAILQASQIPEIPLHLLAFGVLIGSIVVPQAGGSFTEILSPVDQFYDCTQVANHANLSHLAFADSGHTGFANSGANDNITSMTGLEDGGIPVAKIDGAVGGNPAIETPSVTYPTDTAIGIPLSFSATGTTYRSLYDYSQADAQIQLSKLSDFSVLEIDELLGTAGISFSISGLDINTLYYCKIRYQDSAGVWSEWSDIISFTTANIYIDKPTNVSPADTEANIGETPELSSDAFECVNGSDTHLSSDWEVYSDAGLTSLVWSSYDDTSNLESITIPAGNLSEGETFYYWRCRHTGTTYGDSEWSTETSFTTVASFANIVGIALVSAGGGAGTWQQIDADGNNISPDAAFFSNHAVYGNISDVTIDSQAMVKIPKFYVKQDIAGGDQTGKKAWWISDVPTAGFTLHPAFMDSGVEIDQFYYGKYEATDDGGTKAGSVSGVQPLVSIDFPTMQSRCTARNTGGIEGFHMLNIHELSAVQVLCLIKEGTPDVQAAIGAGNTASSAAVNTGSSNAVWYGIYELWGNVFCMIDGVQFDTNNQIKVFDQNGNETYVSTGVTASATDGWLVSMHDDSGTGFDLGMLFLGKTFDSTEGNGTFGDYEYSPDLTNDNVCYHGGRWSNGSQAGLFYLALNGGAASSNTYYGSRLAKV